ncbi:hypothetical protein N8T08_010354 [Aspergillus melleus]|uniref:Uncharacterized protein n=1 Tax=Aspergillus melleus TaxID=138277 RepID=A0ACC3ASV3_9EURO|nr:hypothetical protein N8T08_010354 [Aspergillus melleus]
MTSFSFGAVYSSYAARRPQDRPAHGRHQAQKHMRHEPLHAEKPAAKDGPVIQAVADHPQLQRQPPLAGRGRRAAVRFVEDNTVQVAGKGDLLRSVANGFSPRVPQLSRDVRRLSYPYRVLIAGYIQPDEQVR